MDNVSGDLLRAMGVPRKNKAEYNAYMRDYMRERAAKLREAQPAAASASEPIRHDPLLNTQQAAELIGMSVSWLQDQRWLQKGPPYVKLGRSVRYQAKDLMAWVEAQKERADF